MLTFEFLSKLLHASLAGAVLGGIHGYIFIMVRNKKGKTLSIIAEIISVSVNISIEQSSSHLSALLALDTLNKWILINLSMGNF